MRDDFGRTALKWVGGLTIGVLLFGLVRMCTGDALESLASNCPVAVGMRVVKRDGDEITVGTVRAIARDGAFTQNCKAGVVWDNGEHHYRYGWALLPVGYK